MTYLTDDAIDTDSLIRSVMRATDGACVVFEGVVRNHHEGKRVESIFYDAYRPMAEKEITKIINDIESQFAEVATAYGIPLEKLVRDLNSLVSQAE